MKATRTVLLVVTAFLAACQPHDDFLTWATVLDVQEMQTTEEAEQLVLRDEDLRIPEVAWQLELRLDDGETVSLQRNGSRRYEPGERVRVLKRDDGELLL